MLLYTCFTLRYFNLMFYFWFLKNFNLEKAVIVFVNDQTYCVFLCQIGNASNKNIWALVSESLHCAQQYLLSREHKLKCPMTSSC
ncbi:hypothetical protein VNO77_43676 [Canavalia gladiata]|uniref:Uncharacterized protein n=1 Tax=Canavalia gladiata TaxID=3824 RepID=A0AAN9PN40_CANGL